MKEVYSRVDRSKELGFHVSEFPLEILQNFESGQLRTTVDFAMDLEPTKGVAVVHLSVEVIYGPTFSALGHNCIVEFLISDLQGLVDSDGLLSSAIWMELVDETYSLMRGMIAVRTLGFGIHDFPLPFLAYDQVLPRIEEMLAEKRAGK